MSTEDANRCWVEVTTPWDRDTLLLFLQDVHRLFRLNPMVAVETWQQEGERVFFRGRMEEGGAEVTATFRIAWQADALILHHEQGWKESTRFTLTPAADGGTLLTLEEFYRPANDKDILLRQQAVDQSLIPWGVALHSHLTLRHKTAWLPLFHAYLDHIHLAMTPRNRRITGLILILSLAEFILFLGVLAVYLL